MAVVGILMIPKAVTREMLMNELGNVLKLRYTALSEFQSCDGSSFCHVFFDDELQARDLYSIYPVASKKNGIIYVYYEYPGSLNNK
ncbi:hypothetical protein EB118_15145 [bacterium]|nr:hypothetical protein [bacterium]NDC94469.1 hypothetical protein [bacterium]NDD85023.1 hypothetical protein [bacterium]NDG31391.1 hypothetical protein [bacterium]